MPFFTTSRVNILFNEKDIRQNALYNFNECNTSREIFVRKGETF